jgi:N-methylhydantoinase A/oxoprolinase/acetone carboxylase beta subunit
VGQVAVSHTADLCYVGQSHTIEIALDDPSGDGLARLQGDFVAAHRRLYGHASDDPARIVNLRAVHRAASLQTPWPPLAPDTAPARKGTRPVLLPGRRERSDVAIWNRPALKAGEIVAGPAIVEQDDTTTLIADGWTGTMTAQGNLVLTRGGRPA